MRIKNIFTQRLHEAELRLRPDNLPGMPPVLCLRHLDGSIEPVDSWPYEIIAEDEEAEEG